MTAAPFSFTCSLCGWRGEAGTLEDLQRAVAAHEKKCTEGGVLGRPRRISEVLPPEVLSGNLLTIEEVLEKDLLVVDFTFKESTFREDAEYLSLKVELEDEEFTINTGATRVVQVFRQIKKEDLPLWVTFEKVILPGGRRVYRVKE